MDLLQPTWPGEGWAVLRALTQEELGAVAEAAVLAAWEGA